MKRSDAPEVLITLPKRWIVERTFARISRNRRLARAFERYATTVAAFVRLAMLRITPLRRESKLSGWAPRPCGEAVRREISSSWAMRSYSARTISLPYVRSRRRTVK